MNICRRLSAAYNDMKLFSTVSEEFIAMFLNAFAVEAKQIETILRRNKQLQEYDVQYSSTVFSASMSTTRTSYQLSIRNADDWLGALAIVCSNDSIDDVCRDLRLIALLELFGFHQHYRESFGEKFLCDVIDDLVGNDWRAPLRIESLLVFANVWLAPIVILNLQT